MSRLFDINGHLRITPTRLYTRIIRDLNRVQKMGILIVRSVLSSASIIDENSDIDISLTSHGKRLNRVHLSIESIARGSDRPRSITLWLDASDYEKTRTKALRRLILRGLTIKKSTGNFGPHTKYYPHVLENYPNLDPVVTADDDIIYPQWWLSRLRESIAVSEPDEILAYRAHRITTSLDWLDPYNSWKLVEDQYASRNNFLTGVSGVYYPASFLDKLVDSGTYFSYSCPKADDIWLNVIALRNGYTVKQVSAKAMNFMTIPGTQTERLQKGNVGEEGNDRQIRSTYNDADFRLLEQCNNGRDR